LAVLAIVVQARTLLFNRISTPVGWVQGMPAAKSAKMSFTVAMKQQNLDKLDATFQTVTDPDSVNWRRWLTAEQVQGLTAASPEHTAAVEAFLATSGASCTTRGDHIACEGTVADVEALFNTDVFEFHNSEHSSTIRAAWGEQTIPDHLAEAVDMVSGLSFFPVHRARLGRVEALNDNDYLVVPETIAAFYKTEKDGNAQSTQAPIEFQNYPAVKQSDLDTFITQTAIQSFQIAKKVGPFNDQFPGAESTLDVQYLGATGEGNTNWYWTEQQWLYDFTSTFSSTTDVPSVISLSYGWDEEQQCRIDPVACAEHFGNNNTMYVNRVNTEFQKIGVRGVSILVSAGDAGAHGRTDESCLTSKTTPTYPAGSPYVTTVGATQIKNGVSNGANAPVCQTQQCATGGTEIVASHGTGALITSGGGFSNVAARPSYQDDAVKAYLAQSGATPADSDFNSAGRGYPDVAALGHKYYIELNGQAVTVDGTSCSAPVFAGVVGLLNADLGASNEAPLGFLNPLFYKMAAADASTFTDVTEGNNKCTEQSCCQTGFSATSGWDAVSGLGTPVYPKMKAYIKSQVAAHRA
jgi:tripeptidyl-peptidase-1